jgi:acetyltransferase-like isoleucine patch superfamily enzyme
MIIRRLKWFLEADRLGPDMILTHWAQHFPHLNRHLCLKKFKLFGDNSQVRPYSFIINSRSISIGNNVIVRSGSILSSSEDPTVGITIEDNVLLAPGVKIVCDNHEFMNPDVPISEQGYRKPLPVLISKGAWIGTDAILLPGITIGINSVVGAGSVVTKSIPDYAVAVGNPAKVIKFTKS